MPDPPSDDAALRKIIRVLGLSALIDAKQRAGRPKDLAVLPVLRATLDEAKRRG